MATFKIDGVEYNVEVKEISQSFEKLSTDKSGRLINGDMFIDLIGTYYNYTMTIFRKGYDYAQYDTLWMALSEPVDFQTIEFPHNQETLTFEAYVTKGQRALIMQKNSNNLWGDITISFIAKSPQRRPS
jgi:hypothetical protein